MRQRRTYLALFGILAIACRDEAPALTGAWQPGACARLADDVITCAQVATIVEKQGTTEQVAAALLAEDARLDVAARAAGLVAPWSRRVALSRATIRHIDDEAAAIQVPTDAEVDQLSAERWAEFDRPAAVRVIHAIALRPKNGSFALARDVAEKVHQSVLAATSPEDFEKRAEAVPHQDVELRVERLPPFDAKGTVTAESVGNTFDVTFAAAAHKIDALGGTSAVVESPFGFHVIRLVEQIPAYAMPRPERRALLAAPARTLRSKKALEEVIARQKQTHPIEISPAGDALVSELLRSYASAR